LESYTNTTDKRIKTVSLTKAGLECCINSRDNLENAEKMLMSGLTSEDQESLRKLLLKVSKNVK
jgi:DNA-binding MarR family transcriptional regulator